MVLSASTPASLTETKGKSSYEYLKTQTAAAVLGFCGMMFLSRLNINFFKKLSPIIYIILTALMFYTGIEGVAAGGARRWLTIKGLGTFQPSELAKFGYVIVFAHYLSSVRKNNSIKKITWGALYPILLLAPIIFAVFKLQNHLSATILITATTLVQMFIAGSNIIHVLFIISICGCGYLGYDKVKNINKVANGEAGGFRSERFLAWRDPEKYATGKGFQILQSMYAIASGGILGLGLGNSKQKYILPEPQNDFIFSILCEELGFAGGMVVIILFALLIWRGIVIAKNAKDSFLKLTAAGITVILGLQVVLNIAVVTNSIPVTGIPLPFFSYGGTALAINLCAMGLLQNISRLNDVENKE